MKVVHVSDIHLNDQPILGSDPVANFGRCWSHIGRHHADAQAVVISGDLTHHGKRSSYELLREMLRSSPVNPRLMIGNHDDRGTFRSVFPEVPVDANGFVQYAEDTPAGRFLYLDTAESGTHAGHYCEARRAWLTTELALARENRRPVYLFMHHPPLNVGVQSSDIIGLVDGEPFRTILKANRDVIRHIFFGHCHYILSGSVCGIPISAPRSTSHPCVPEFEGRAAVGYGPLPPTYDVCLISDEATVIHSIDFLAEDQIVWEPIDAEGWIDETPEAALGGKTTFTA